MTTDSDTDEKHELPAPPRRSFTLMDQTTPPSCLERRACSVGAHILGNSSCLLKTSSIRSRPFTPPFGNRSRAVMGNS